MKKILLLLIMVTFNPIFHAKALSPEAALPIVNNVISPKEIKLTIENLNSALQANYLNPQNAKQLVKRLQSMVTIHKLQQSNDRIAFEQDIRKLIVDETNDKRFELLSTNSLNINQLNTQQTQEITANKSPITIQITDNNIGYLSIRGALTSNTSSDSITKSFKKLSVVDALIIDLIDAEETTLSLVLQMLSHFIPPNSHVGNINLNDRVVALTTTEIDGLAQYHNKFPLYILNSAFVTGPWEYFSYTLKNLDRALIIGEDTMGQTYLMKSVPISENLVVNIPFATITQPDSDDTWQFGVTPDIHLPANEAKKKAHKLAFEQVSIGLN